MLIFFLLLERVDFIIMEPSIDSIPYLGLIFVGIASVAWAIIMMITVKITYCVLPQVESEKDDSSG